MNPPLISLLLLAGTSLLFLLPGLPPLTAGLAALLAVGGIHLWRRRVWTAAAMVLIGGVVWAAVNAQAGLDSRLPYEAGRIDTQVNGTVISLVRRSTTTLAFRIETTLPQNPQRPVRVDLRWYEFPPEARQPRPGEIWQLNVRLRTPRGSANPGRRHWEDHAFRHDVAATGYVRRGTNVYIKLHPWRGTIERLRDDLSHELIAGLADHHTAPLVVALAVGDRQYLSDSHWQVLRRTGLSHLVAISGLHIGIVAGLAYVVGAIVVSAVVAGMPHSAGGAAVDERRGIGMACLASAVMALSYAALAGFTVPTRRALVVVFVFLAARVSRRTVRPVYALSIALSVVLVADPRSVLEAGFWLSFAAVAVILYSGSGQLSRGALRDLLRIQFAVMIGLAPLMIILFGQLSLAAPLVNFFLLPLFSFFLVPAVLLGVFVQAVHEQAGFAVLRVIVELLDRLWPALTYLSELGLVARPSGAPSTMQLALAVFGALWFLAPRGWPARGLGVICLLPALLSPPSRPAPGSFELTVLDVGQGLAAVVRTNRHVLVFDTGPKWRSGSDAASRVLLPYLDWAGITDIDRLVVSHGDADHAGGVPTVRKRYPGVAVLASGIAGLNHCQRGQRWFWDGVGFEILHPLADAAWSDNDASCVLSITNGRGCTLLTGDIEADAERELARDAGRLNCELVLAPHHGSETSSTPEFIDATRARFVLVSASFSNQWGFPRPAVVQRWRQSGAAVLSTATVGAITAHVDTDGKIAMDLHRCTHRRFWRPDCR